MQKSISVFILFGLVFFLLFSGTSSAAQVTLAWNANNPAPEGYRLYQRLPGQAYNYASPAWSGAGTTCTITNLADGTIYYFVVRAFQGSNQSGDSNELQYVTGPAPTPPPDSDGDGIIDANDAFPNNPAEWLDSDEDSIGDNGDLDDDNDGVSDAVETAEGADPFDPGSYPHRSIVLGPEFFTLEYPFVKSDFSSAFAGKVAWLEPGTGEQGKAEFSLDIDIPGDYYVYIRTQTGEEIGVMEMLVDNEPVWQAEIESREMSWQEVMQEDGSGPVKLHLTAGQHTFTFVNITDTWMAFDMLAMVNYEPYAVEESPPEVYAPAEVQGVILTDTGTALRVDWQANYDPVDGYWVYYSLYPGTYATSNYVDVPANAAIAELPAVMRTWYLAGYPVYVKTVALTVAGESQDWEEVSITYMPPTPPAEPAQNITYTANAAARQISLFWDSVSDADGYKVSYSLYSGKYTLAPAVTAANSHTITLASPYNLYFNYGYTVYVRITPFNQYGDGPSVEIPTHK